MTSLMTSPGHKIGQILKLIYLRQYLSESVEYTRKIAMSISDILSFWSTL